MAAHRFAEEGCRPLPPEGDTKDDTTRSGKDHSTAGTQPNVDIVRGLQSDADDMRGCGRSRRLTEQLTPCPRVRGWGILLHAPGLIISAVLVYINASNLFWFEIETDIPVVGDTSNVLHLLQLAAKICEMLLTLSLTTLVLSVYRRMLISTGLPLGLIASGYQTGSLTYLTRSSLLQGLAVGKRYMLFGMFIIISTVLAILAGPTCATLVVPTAGWYPMGDNYADIMPPVYFTRDRASIWSSTVIEPGKPNRCKAANLQPPYCPGYGVTEVFDWTRRLGFTSDTITLQSPTPSTAEIRRQVFTSPVSNSSATMATTPSSVTGLILASYFDFAMQRDLGPISHAKQVGISTREDEENLQPLTQVKCQGLDLDSAKAALQTNNKTALPFWPMDGVECFDDTACASWQAKAPEDRLVDRMYWEYLVDATNITVQYNQDHPLGRTGNSSFQWVETEGSLGAIFRLPYLIHPNPTYLAGTKQSYFLTACSLVSRWVPSVTEARLLQTDVLKTNISDLAAFSDRPGRPPGGHPIRVTKSWADYLDFPIPIAFSNGSMTNATIGAISHLLGAMDMCWANRSPDSNILCTSTAGGVAAPPDFPPVSSPTSTSYRPPTAMRTVEKLLGILLADALSRYAVGNPPDSSSCRPVVVLERTSTRIRYRDLTAQPLSPGFFGLGNYTIVPDSPANMSSWTKVYVWDGQKEVRGGRSSNLTMAEWEETVRSWMRMELTVKRYGYGFGRGRATLIGAYSVLGVYVTMVVVLTLTDVVSWFTDLTRWCSRARHPHGMQSGEKKEMRDLTEGRDIQDLVALAWRSREPSGVEDVSEPEVASPSSIWEKVLTVRVTERGGPELVLRDGGDVNTERK